MKLSSSGVAGGSVEGSVEGCAAGLCPLASGSE